MFLARTLLDGDPPLFDNVREAAVRNLAVQYESDMTHVEHVAKLSLQMFDSLVTAGLFTPAQGERELLWAASMLHDVGMTISYDDHHKHSRYLIESAELPGFDPRERALIAQITRYHRKGIPKLGIIEAIAQHGDEELLDRCAVILRLAEHLERGRDQSVSEARLDTNGDGIDLHLKAGGRSHPAPLERRALRGRRGVRAGVQPAPAHRLTPVAPVPPEPPASPDSPARPAAVASPSVVAREWTRLGLIGFGGPAGAYRPAAPARGRPAPVDGRARLRGRQRRLRDAPGAGVDADGHLLRLPRRPVRRGGHRGPRLHRPRGRADPGAVAARASATRRRCGCAARAPGRARRCAAVAVQAARGLLGPSLARVRESRSAVRAGRPTSIAGGAAAALIGPYLVLVLLGCGAGRAGLQRRRRGGVAAGAARLPPPAPCRPGGYGALAWTAFKVGALSFGGGFVIIPLMQGDAVHVYHWMTNAQFLNAVALGQVTPGPVVATIAAVGYAAHGLAGGLLAARDRVRAVVLVHAARRPAL